MKRIFALLLAAALLGGCAQQSEGRTQWAALLRQANNERREALGQPAFPMPEYPAGGQVAFTPEEVEQLTTEHRSPVLTRQEAKEDVETCFRMLQDAYGGYYWMGGDAVFAQAQAQALDSLAQRPGKIVLSSDLAALLRDALSFIRDGHFQIDGQHLLPEREIYSCPTVFEKEAAAYRLEWEGRQWRLTDEKVAALLRPSLDAQGDLCYRLFATTEPGETLPQNAAVVRWGRECSMPLEWARVEPADRTGGALVEEYCRDGVRVCSVRQMGGSAAAMEHFVEAGARMAQEDVALLDLRGNRGGSSEYPFQWFGAFTGQEPVRREAYANRLSPLAVTARQKENPELRLQPAPPEGLWQTGSWSGQWVQNDGTTLLVLIDADVASAAESCVEYLRTLDNVLFIGTNTRGCSAVGNVSTKYLPHSGISLYFGQSLYLIGGENRDGVGYEPDVWMEPEQALDAAEALAAVLRGG